MILRYISSQYEDFGKSVQVILKSLFLLESSEDIKYGIFLQISSPPR